MWFAAWCFFILLLIFTVSLIACGIALTLVGHQHYIAYICVTNCDTFGTIYWSIGVEENYMRYNAPKKNSILNATDRLWQGQSHKPNKRKIQKNLPSPRIHAFTHTHIIYVNSQRISEPSTNNNNYRFYDGNNILVSVKEKYQEYNLSLSWGIEYTQNKHQWKMMSRWNRFWVPKFRVPYSSGSLLLQVK